MKKIICIILIFLLTVGSFSLPSNASTIANDNTTADILLEKRAEYICSNNYEKLEEIDKQLEKLGTYKLSSSETLQLFNTLEQNENSATPYVVKPVSDTVTWFTSRTDYTYNGTTYEIQTLTAQPNGNNSNLALTGAKVIESNIDLVAGATNVLEVIGSTIAGTIPNATKVLTIYDLLSAFCSGLSTTTVIENITASYTYSHTTTMRFKYVKIKGQSDNLQRLSHISSSAITKVTTVTPEIKVENGIGVPDNATKTETVYSTPSGYNSNSNAAKGYVNSRTYTSFTDKIDIIGVNDKRVYIYYPIQPQSPAQVY